MRAGNRTGKNADETVQIIALGVVFRQAAGTAAYCVCRGANALAKTCKGKRGTRQAFGKGALQGRRSQGGTTKTGEMTLAEQHTAVPAQRTGQNHRNRTPGHQRLEKGCRSALGWEKTATQQGKGLSSASLRPLRPCWAEIGHSLGRLRGRLWLHRATAAAGQLSGRSAAVLHSRRSVAAGCRCWQGGRAGCCRGHGRSCHCWDRGCCCGGHGCRCGGCGAALLLAALMLLPDCVQPHH